LLLLPSSCGPPSLLPRKYFKHCFTTDGLKTFSCLVFAAAAATFAPNQRPNFGCCCCLYHFIAFPSPSRIKAVKIILKSAVLLPHSLPILSCAFFCLRVLGDFHFICLLATHSFTLANERVGKFCFSHDSRTPSSRVVEKKQRKGGKKKHESPFLLQRAFFIFIGSDDDDDDDKTLLIPTENVNFVRCLIHFAC